MSHYAEMQCEYKQKSEKEFIAALELVFGEGHVELHEEGAGLMGYGGDNRSQKSEKSKDYAPPCHVIIRRKHVGGASNDVGFRRNEEGGYTAFVSDFDKGRNFDTKKQHIVAQEYAARVTEKTMKAQGYAVKRTNVAGKVKITCTKWG
jgi:hypothetical protein